MYAFVYLKLFSFSCFEVVCKACLFLLLAVFLTCRLSPLRISISKPSIYLVFIAVINYLFFCSHSFLLQLCRLLFCGRKQMGFLSSLLGFIGFGIGFPVGILIGFYVFVHSESDDDVEVIHDSKSFLRFMLLVFFLCMSALLLHWKVFEIQNWLDLFLHCCLICAFWSLDWWRYVRSSVCAFVFPT